MDGSCDVEFISDANEHMMTIFCPKPFECRGLINVVDDLSLAFVGGVCGEGGILCMKRDIPVDQRDGDRGNLSTMRNGEEQKNQNADRGDSDEPRAEFSHTSEK